MRRPRTKTLVHTATYITHHKRYKQDSSRTRARSRTHAAGRLCERYCDLHSCELAVSVCRSWPGGSRDRSTCCDVGERATKSSASTVCLSVMARRSSASTALLCSLSRPLLMSAHASARAHAARAGVGVIVDGVLARWRCAAVSLARRRRRSLLHCDAQPQEVEVHHGHASPAICDALERSRPE